MRLVTLGTSLVALILAVGPLAACAPTDPKDPATWIAKLDQKDPQKVADAVHELRKLKAKSAVEPLEGLLKSDSMNVRAEVADALRDIGDPSAVQALMDGLDLNSTEKGAELANKSIAEALGALGDKKALPVLNKALQSGTPLVRLSAVESIGKLRDPSSIPTLVRLVEDETTPPLITKKAIVALGEMKAGDAVPALEKALVMERQGVSFFSEASFALFQIGQPAEKGLLAIVEGSDKAYLKWADDKNRQPAGYLSKAAIVLADLGDKSSVPDLVKLLNWKDPNDEDMYQMIVRGTVGEALGRLRAKEGAAPIGGQVNIAEANIREKFAVALAHIGDKASLAKLEAAAKDPKSTWSAKQAAITGLALLGDGKNKGVIEALVKSETPDASVKHCLAEDSGAENEAMKANRCEKERTLRPAFLAEELATLMAGDECKEDADCWIGKLKDKQTHVRERAAYTLGKLGNPKGVPALVAACKDEQLPVRRAAYIALDWMSASPEAKTALVAVRGQLAQQLEDEKGKAYTFVVNEDLKRVVWKLNQL